jgi:hypothetical protein
MYWCLVIRIHTKIGLYKWETDNLKMCQSSSIWGWQGEIKRKLNYGNACYQSAQNLLSSRLLSKSVKIRIYKSMILPDVLCGCET